MQYTIEQIAGIVNAEGRLASPGEKITRLLTDSRSLYFPEETLFFAIKTRHGDGHKYVEELYSRGVRNFAVTDMSGFDHLEEANFIIVKNTVKALQKLVSRPVKLSTITTFPSLTI